MLLLALFNRDIRRQVIPDTQWGYATPADEKLFDEFPDTYEPNPDYRGTMKPGLGKENMPFSDLELCKPHEDFAAYEVPFHHCWPRNHPYLPGPVDRMEMAGRFITEEEFEIQNKKNKQVTAPVVEVLDTLGDDTVKTDVKPDEDRDPTFDDASSSLLDAALGLDDQPADKKDDTKQQEADKTES